MPVTINGSDGGNAFTQGSILGTVSQVAGVPTGAIIEASNNANGTYIKFADGTMICQSPFATSYGTSFAWTYPAPFVSTPSITAIGSSNDSVNFRIIKFHGVETGILACGLYANADTSFTAMAIGRWF